MSYNNYTILPYESQVENLLMKASIKKSYNTNVIKFLRAEGKEDIAHKIEECATMIGFTDVDGRAKIVKANFCRQRVCGVCAWRRQSKFLAQMFPVLDILSNDGYFFLMATLTVKNCAYEDLKEVINRILTGYDRLLKRRKVKKSWLGVVRSVELTYNAEEDTFHPHLHLLIAVRQSYFTDSNLYFTQKELCSIWGECLDVTYTPVCHIQTVEDEGGAVETIKYSLKPSKADKALKAFFYALKNRRLVSFSGVFAKIRHDLKLSDFENVLTDDVLAEKGYKKYSLYSFDVTGGTYKFYKTYEITNNERW